MAIGRLRRPVDAGVATLTMVMLLFFVMAMVAAYTNRNLLYEQRMSINNFRATAAMSAADAGIDWAIAMLSGARVDSNCLAPAAPIAADLDFRSRYTILQPDGSYTAPQWGAPPATPSRFFPSCVLTNAGWSCKCPDAAVPLPALDYPATSAPIFDIDISSGSGPGILKVEVRGSHEASREMSFGTFGNYVRLRVSLGLTRALPVPPVAALTVGGTVNMDPGLSLAVSNPDPKTGVAVHVGAGLNANAVTGLVQSGPAGSAVSATIDPDPKLAVLAGPPSANVIDFFQSIFGMDASTYSRQPAAVFIDCNAGCNSASIATAVTNNPGRIIWVNGGDIDLSAGGTLGTPARPVMLVATRDITLSAPTTINGFIYSGRNVVWGAAAEGSLVRGALIARGDFSGSSNVNVAYDPDILQLINLSYGSFVRIPGTWQVVPTR